MRYLNISKDRYNIKEPIDRKELLQIAEDRDIKVLQISESIQDVSWKEINRTIVKSRPDIEIRLLHFLNEECDLSVLRFIPEVQRLSIDHIKEVDNIEYLSYLKCVKSFSIGIFSLESFGCLKMLPLSVQELYIIQTKSKKPDLKVLERFKDLEVLFVEGHNKGIYTISKLSKLKELTLRSVKVDNLDFLKDLNELRVLDIKLGSVKDFSALEQLKKLKYLELWQVRCVEDLDFVSKTTGLETLFLQSLNKVTKLPDFKNLNKMKRLYLENMNNLSEFENLNTLTSIEELYVIDAKKQNPENYYIVLENESMQGAQGFFGGKKKNDSFKERLKKAGLNKALKVDKKSWR